MDARFKGARARAHGGFAPAVLGLLALLQCGLPGHSWAASACPPTACRKMEQGPADDTLVRVSAQDRKAVILIGGIDDNYHYFAPWISELAQSGDVVFGFNHNHRRESMSNASRLLEARMEVLADAGFDDVVLLAHSMGGLVAKKAIDIAVQKGLAPRFKRLELRAFGTPWGGFAKADMLRAIPFGDSISRWMGAPMAVEIGSTSAFMQSLSMPWPANTQLYVYLGSKDTIAQPETASEKERYKANTGHARGVQYLQGVTHNDYVRLPAPALESGDCHEGRPCGSTRGPAG